VRNPGDTPGGITGVPTFAQLVDNPNLAALYTEIRCNSTATAPELIETLAVSKKTVYDYLDSLEQAGLLSAVDDDGGATVYAAEPFKLTLTVRETEVSITPDLIAIIAHAPAYPIIERVLDDHGIVTFALAHDLVVAHSRGEVTIRQFADLAGLSAGTAYDLVDALYAILELGNEETPTTYTPKSFDEPDDGLLAEFVDNNEL